MNGYRTSPQILSEVLLITNSCDRHGVAVTKLCHDANLSHGRLKKLIVKLTDAGLMNKIEYDGKNTFVVTDKGKVFLDRYKQFTDIAESFGLDM